MKHITHTSIDIASVLEKAHNTQAGAVVLFCGDVRNHNLGKKVTHLYYDCYEMLAEKMIPEVLQEAKEKWGLYSAECIHRVGEVKPSETAVIIITVSAHRAAAYEANQYIIERIKHEVPIWKKEYYEDQSYMWASNTNTPKQKVLI